MNKFLLTVAAVFLTGFTACSQKGEQNDMNKTHRTLVAYFSATGTTARAAHIIADVTGSELFVIDPQTPYSNADLNWHDKQSRSSVEMDNPKARPALKLTHEEIADYDTVFIGYPIWWDLAPRIINTFIESHDLQGKILIPFATSGGSGIANSVNALKKEYPALQWRDGKLLNRTDRETVKEWIETL